MGSNIKEEKKAVYSGYWHLYRYNPDLKQEGKNPFVLHSKEPILPYEDFINGEIRYTSLKTTFPKIVEEMFALSKKNDKERYETYKKLAE